MSTRPHRAPTASGLILAAASLLTACAGTSAPTPTPTPPSPSSTADAPPHGPPLPELDAAGLEALSGVNFFFAHRSVGADIVELGVPAVFDEYGVARPGSFGDHWLDQTEDPASKLADFDHWIRNEGIGSTTDIALMKLGYVDILEDTDVQGLFDDYRATLDALEADYPRVVFLHATVSVTAWVPENNAAIERFNALMRAKYASSGRLFDLAAVVSTCADGMPARDETDDGDVFSSICPEYTRDGGHLNELGAKVAAEEMLRLLMSVTPEAR